jgi:hypothetical protein
MATTIATTETSRANQKTAHPSAANDDAQDASLVDQASRSSYQHAYHELAHGHDSHTDVLVQLRSNLAQLEDLHARLKFMMGELSYLLKKD